jgi:hypothetical protein
MMKKRKRKRGRGGRGRKMDEVMEKKEKKKMVGLLQPEAATHPNFCRWGTRSEQLARTPVKL